MAKKVPSPIIDDNISDGDRQGILRAICDKIDREPPLGERYGFLLNDPQLSEIMGRSVS